MGRYVLSALNKEQSNLREAILKEKNITSVDGKLAYEVQHLEINKRPNRSVSMRILESATKKDMTELLDPSKTLAELALEFGVGRTTILKWRKKLGVKGGKPGRPKGSKKS